MSDFNQSQQQVDTQYNANRDIIFYAQSASGKPLHRPPRAIHFTNRTTELEQLLADLQPRTIITLCGPGGIGKTALAAEALWYLAPHDEPPERFSDGIVFHSFYGQPDTDLALESIARAFGEEPKPNPATAAQRALAGKRVLMLLDGTEEADDLPKIQAVASDCAILITSRRKKDAAAKRRDITPLERNEAIKLLHAWAGDQVDDDAVAASIVELIGELPLAVRLVGRYLDQTGETATEYLQWLSTSPMEALNPDGADHRMESVPWLLQRSLEQVGEKARDILALAGQLALRPFEQNMIQGVLDFSESTMKRAFKSLSDYGLLFRTKSGRYEVSHALIHTYAREHLGVEDEEWTRLVTYTVRLAESETKKGLEGYRHLDEERPHMMRLLRSLVDRSEWAMAERLAWAIEDYLDIQGHWTERLIVNETGLQVARKQGNRESEGAWMGNLGLAYRDLGQVEKAIGYYEEGLVISREIGPRQGEGNHLGNLGLAYYALGQVEKAIGYYEEALVISREIGDRQSEGNHLGNLGIAYRDLGQVEKAIGYYEEALVISREIGDRQGEGNHLGNLGLAYRALGQVEKAIGYYEEALVISREIGHRQGEGSRLGNLGLAYSDLGQVEKAIGYYEEALVISREIGYRQGEGSLLGNLGIAYSDLGQVEKARECWRASLAIFEEIKSPHVQQVEQWLRDLDMK